MSNHVSIRGGGHGSPHPHRGGGGSRSAAGLGANQQPCLSAPRSIEDISTRDGWECSASSFFPASRLSSRRRLDPIPSPGVVGGGVKKLAGSQGGGTKEHPGSSGGVSARGVLPGKSGSGPGRTPGRRLSPTASSPWSPDPRGAPNCP